MSNALRKIEKHIEYTGKNGRFCGFITVMFNHRTEQRNTTHAGTHDEVLRTVDIHQITSRVDRPQQEINRKEFDSESMALKLAEDFENELMQKLMKLATEEKYESVEDKLRAKGFE